MPRIDHLGSLPGTSEYTFKGWVCSLKDDYEEMTMKMYIDGEGKKDMGVGGDMEGMNGGMEMDQMMMAMMMMMMSPPQMQGPTLPGPANGPNYNLMMYQQYLMHQQMMMMKKMKEHKMEDQNMEHRKHCEMEQHKKEVLHHLEMACMNDTITSKFHSFILRAT